LQIWQSIAGRSQPIYSFKYQFAIKALAWCPWQNNILASAGGFQTIKFWDINTGKLKKAHFVNYSILKYNKSNKDILM